MKDFSGRILPIPVIYESGEVNIYSKSMFCTSTNEDIELLFIEEANMLYREIKEYSPETKVIQNFAPRIIDDFNHINELEADGIEISPRFYRNKLKRPFAVTVSGDNEELKNEVELYMKEINRMYTELKEGISSLDLNIPILFKCERNIFAPGFDQFHLDVDGFTYGNTLKFGSYGTVGNNNVQRYGKGSLTGECLTEDTKNMIPLLRKVRPDKYISASGGIMNLETTRYLLDNGANSVQLCSAIYLHGQEIVRTISEGLKK